MFHQVLRKATLAATLILGMAGVAQAATFNVTNITGNDAEDAAFGEAQLFVDVLDVVSDAVYFVFRNEGPEQMTIADIYFDFGTTSYLTGGTVGDASAGVEFEAANSGNLPGGMPIGFTDDAVFKAKSPKPKNGVNTAEFQTIIFSLTNGSTFEDVLAAVTAGDLRAGFHVINYASGGSESFVTSQVPLPAGLPLLLAGLGALALVRRRKA